MPELMIAAAPPLICCYPLKPELAAAAATTTAAVAAATAIPPASANNNNIIFCTKTPSTSTAADAAAAAAAMPSATVASAADKNVKRNRRGRISCPTLSDISTKFKASSGTFALKAHSFAAKFIPQSQKPATTTTKTRQQQQEPNAAEKAQIMSKARKQPSYSLGETSPIPFVSVCEAASTDDFFHEKNKENFEFTKSCNNNNSSSLFDDGGDDDDKCPLRPRLSLLNIPKKVQRNSHPTKPKALSVSEVLSKSDKALGAALTNATSMQNTSDVNEKPTMDFLRIEDHACRGHGGGAHGHASLCSQISGASGSSQMSLGASAVTPTFEDSATGFLSKWLSTSNESAHTNNNVSAGSGSGPLSQSRNSARSYASSECSTATTVSQVRPSTVAALMSSGWNGETNTFDQLLRSALLKVSVDTMAITALPLDCWLKERLKNWVQLSGHAGTIVPASNHTLWKKQPSSNTTEAIAYAEIMADTALRGLTPKFYKEITHKNESFIEIQDLLAQYPNTSSRAIMDIKIGIRTFLESEVSNTTKRTDLFKKMIDIDANEPTEEERADGAITKLRYMQFRERESSTASLGFRIEAAQLPGGKLQKSFKKVQTKTQVLDTLVHFFGARHAEICGELAERLRAIRDGIEKSEFFRTHEVVGSSILIVYDNSKAGAWMIDFAKSMTVPENTALNHRTPWELGNHEDGYLIGLENLIDILEMGEKGSEKITPPSVLTPVNK